MVSAHGEQVSSDKHWDIDITTGDDDTYMVCNSPHVQKMFHLIFGWRMAAGAFTMISSEKNCPYYHGKTWEDAVKTANKRMTREVFDNLISDIIIPDNHSSNHNISNYKE